MELKSTPAAVRTNPIHGFSGRALAVLDTLAGSPAWSMTPTEQAEALVELTQVEARVTELRWRVMAAAARNEIGAKEGFTGTAAWLSARTRLNRAKSNGDLRGAALLDTPRFEATREAFARGQLTEAQTWAIIRAVEDLPAGEVTDEQRLVAQQHLIRLAAEHDAQQLQILGRRVFDVVAPEEAERREGEALERKERRALEGARFSMRDNGDGTVSGWFKLPTLQAEMLGKAVGAFASPRRTDPAAWLDAEGRRRPYSALLGEAFTELVEHLPVDRLPQAGGTTATVLVTMDLGSLLSGLSAASLDTGGRISAGQARRLACNAGLVPAVLGSGSVPLDLGRTVRLHTAAQRTAMVLRDGGCTAEGCDRPPAWTEAHHELPWSEGGGTSVATGRLLCPRHHRAAHDARYDMRRLPTGKVRFSRRT